MSRDTNLPLEREAWVLCRYAVLQMLPSRSPVMILIRWNRGFPLKILFLLPNEYLFTAKQRPTSTKVASNKLINFWSKTSRSKKFFFSLSKNNNMSQLLRNQCLTKLCSKEVSAASRTLLFSHKNMSCSLFEATFWSINLKKAILIFLISPFSAFSLKSRLAISSLFFKIGHPCRVHHQYCGQQVAILAHGPNPGCSLVNIPCTKVIHTVPSELYSVLYVHSVFYYRRPSMSSTTGDNPGPLAPTHAVALECTMYWDRAIRTVPSVSYSSPLGASSIKLKSRLAQQ